MKQGSAGKRNKEEFSGKDDAGHGTTEDRISPMTPPYLMSSATTATKIASGAEQVATRQTTNGRRQSSSKSTLPPLFIYIEAGDFRRAMERAKRHPREVRTWASIKIKSTSKSNVAEHERRLDTTNRLALHQACFKLRAASTSTVKCYDSKIAEEDPFVEVCRFILFLIEMYPDACRERETRHGCLPLHLAAFASCTQSSSSSKGTFAATANNNDNATPSLLSLANSTFSTSPLSSALPSPTSDTETGKSSTTLSRPIAISHNHRSISETTTDTFGTTMTAAIAEEEFTGIQSERQSEENLQQSGRERSHLSIITEPMSSSRTAAARQQPEQTQSVSMGNNIFVSEKREEWVVKVLNALLDAYPRAIRSGSEGGRLPLHFAAAGRATPRVISTLITAYPEAAKNRTKDGCLPIHLSAHWGISHSNVVVIMLKSYPDSTYGRNRWERTPLEEALCMAGENGRPHQAALVRALRKHHSFWTRPEGVLFHHAYSSSRDATHHIVDIDETVDSMEDSMHGDDDGGEENHLFLDTRGAYSRPRRNNGKHIKGTEPLSSTANDLPTLIRTLNWELAVQRLQMIPGDARLNLRVATRGGFTSTEGFTPLHYACERRPPKEFLNILIDLCPEAVAKKTMPGGKLPLHIACTWHAPKESINVLLAADCRTSKIPDDLGNLPIHSACFSGASSDVVEKLLKAYPKAVLSRTNQGSLPEEITKRLKHDNRISALALLNLCKDEVNTKRKTKHRRNLSEGYTPRTKEAMTFNERGGDFDLMNYKIDNFESSEIEVTYSGENETKKELVWI